METFINIWIVLIIISVIGFAIIPKVRTARREEREQREEEAKKEKYGKLLLDMKDKHLITEAQYKRASYMDSASQADFMDRQFRALRQQQHNFSEQMRFNMEQMEIQMRAATGIEFGGYNPDPNLNNSSSSR